MGFRVYSRHVKLSTSAVQTPELSMRTVDTKTIYRYKLIKNAVPTNIWAVIAQSV
jgi:hypothetical protein